jgi:AcrR family transcriptional regulator
MYTRHVPTQPARDRLLSAAAELVYTGGIEATGVDAIAHRAGVTKRTLYQHFGSKAALVGAALAARDEPALTGLRQAVHRRAAKTGEAPILALFDVLGRLFTSKGWRGCAFQNATLEVAADDHPVHAVARHHLTARRELVAELLHDSGVDTDDGPLGDAVALLVEGAFVVSAAQRDPEVAARARAAVERLLTAA